MGSAGAMGSGSHGVPGSHGVRPLLATFNRQKSGLGLTKKGTAFFVILIIGNEINRSSDSCSTKDVIP